jgi:DivIVA domain-containing protein
MSDLTNYGINLDAHSIHSKQFVKKFRGYDPQEVDEYLDEVIKDYTRMQDIMAQFEADLASIQKVIAQGGEAFDYFMVKRRLEDLELQVFGEKRDRLLPRI